MTQDTLKVVALYKALVEKYKGKEVRIQKLFARHISLKEQQDALAQPVKDDKRVLNVYVGTPNRIKELAKAGSINLASKKFKSIVLDCTLNKKQCTMLETHETRDDCFCVLAHSAALLRARKLKVYAATL
jgi:hypothetical protein